MTQAFKESNVPFMYLEKPRTEFAILVAGYGHVTNAIARVVCEYEKEGADFTLISKRSTNPTVRMYHLLNTFYYLTGKETQQTMKALSMLYRPSDRFTHTLKVINQRISEKKYSYVRNRVLEDSSLELGFDNLIDVVRNHTINHVIQGKRPSQFVDEVERIPQLSEALVPFWGRTQPRVVADRKDINASYQLRSPYANNTNN